MPDWLTHIVIALILLDLWPFILPKFPIKKKSVVLVGALLPDIFPKLFLATIFIPFPEINYNLLGAFHTPFIFFLLSILITPLFRYDWEKIILWLNIGAISHFLADALLRHFDAGVRLLFPLSLKHYTLNLVWPDQSYFILVPALILYLAIKLAKRPRSKSSITIINSCQKRSINNKK